MSSTYTEYNRISSFEEPARWNTGHTTASLHSFDSVYIPTFPALSLLKQFGLSARGERKQCLQVTFKLRPVHTFHPWICRPFHAAALLLARSRLSKVSEFPCQPLLSQCNLMRGWCNPRARYCSIIHDDHLRNICLPEQAHLRDAASLTTARHWERAGNRRRLLTVFIWR